MPPFSVSVVFDFTGQGVVLPDSFTVVVHSTHPTDTFFGPEGVAGPFAMRHRRWLAAAPTPCGTPIPTTAGERTTPGRSTTAPPPTTSRCRSRRRTKLSDNGDSSGVDPSVWLDRRPPRAAALPPVFPCELTRPLAQRTAVEGTPRSGGCLRTDRFLPHPAAP